ncbi:MAG: YqgE/AlgH family protein [Myxococcaceae bacterium]|nr:YqgE/AlgH family protein [Myxococcaceae bacterium]
MRPFSPRLQLTLLGVTALLMLGLFPRLFDRFQEQAQVVRSPEAGLLLVARPGGGDRNFDRTVVLLVEVGPERTWGLVLNRLRTPRDEALPAGAERWGGPVLPEHFATLLRAPTAPDGARRVLEELSWREGLAPEGWTRGGSLTFAGLSVWGPGQLEQELARGGWVLVEADAARVFSEPGALWAECIAPHL